VIYFNTLTLKLTQNEKLWVWTRISLEIDSLHFLSHIFSCFMVITIKTQLFFSWKIWYPVQGPTNLKGSTLRFTCGDPIQSQIKVVYKLSAKIDFRDNRTWKFKKNTLQDHKPKALNQFKWVKTHLLILLFSNRWWRF
jgi:hypothetical protein